MASLHMLGHMVAMAIIATLLKQILELNAEVNKLKEQLEDQKETQNCSRAIEETKEDTTAGDQNLTDNTEECHAVDKKECHAVDKKECHAVDSKECHAVDSKECHTVDSKECHTVDTKECPALDSQEKTSAENVQGDNVINSSSEWSKSPEYSSPISSVWCHEGVNQVCQFKNLCYNSVAEDFVLFHHESSILENVKMEDGAIRVDLSTVRDHNTQQTSIVSLPSAAFQKFQVNWVNKTTLVFRPFLPGNLMHMFHDDIIPLHHTLKLMSLSTDNSYDNSPEQYSVQLFLFENSSIMSDEIEQFYAIFSKYKIKWKDSYKFGSGLTCFRSVYLGLSKSTTWYDYGFTKPQGPVVNHGADGKCVRSTSKYIQHHLSTNSLNFNSQGYIVLMSRKENRKILNEVELTMNLIKSTGLKVVMLNYESYSLAELISYVSHSKGIIAMHGSLLILSMFLKTGSFVIELYPYAVTPSNYTPYKTLSELSGMGLIYRPWVNTIKANSVGHPDWPPESGGINHLDEDQQSVILAQTEVPQHICCSDPSWLYHIYQDTIVETEEIMSLVKNVLSDKRVASSNNTELTFHPSTVQNLACAMKSSNSVKSETIKEGKPFLWLKWDTPWTAYYFDVQTIHYEILLQKYGDLSNLVMSFQSLETGLVIDVEEFMYYNVWVRCVINNNIPGPYTNVLCQR